MNEILVQRTNPLQQLSEFQSKLQKPSESGDAPNFKDMLTKAIGEVDQAHKTSAKQIEGVLGGEVQDVHSALIAMQRADLSFQMMMQVRNKLIEAYQEVMRMQV